MDVSTALELDFEEILKETDKAYQIRFSSTEIHWLPKSQCRIIDKNIYMPKWLVEDKGLQEFIYE